MQFNVGRVTVNSSTYVLALHLIIIGCNNNNAGKAIRSNRLAHDPAKRTDLKEANLKTVLDWLRIVPYSTVDVMVLGKSEAGTRRILNAFVDEGWIIRDEIKWQGSIRKKHLLGISSKGLYERMSEGAIEPPQSRTFKRNRVMHRTC